MSLRMIWMELEISLDGDNVSVSARGSRGERTRTRTLEVSLRELRRFRVHIGNAIARSESLEGPLLERARGLYQALIAEDTRDLFTRLKAAAAESKQRLLVRLMIQDPDLQAVPWEAACRAHTNRGFLASTADVMISRGVNSADAWLAREVRRSLRILPILAISDESALASLTQVLQEHIATGAVEMLEPIVGDAVRNPTLFDRLRSGPSPHVLHFLGHGGFDQQHNPVVRLADDPYGEKTYLPIEVFAEELRDSLDNLRLVYLQACSGGRPGVFASAAEILAGSGVDAVVAHLWPVKAEVARAATREFYSALVGARAGAGDVGASIQATRRTLLADNAEGFSPVLYLRGPDSRLFDLEGRRLRPPRASRDGPSSTGTLPAALQELLATQFSLLLGGAWSEGLTEITDRLHVCLADSLQKRGEVVEDATPLYSLAQRFALRAGDARLKRLFQRELIRVNTHQARAPELLDAIVPFLRPGVHTTLLWLPLLEHTILKHHPEATLYVVQPAPQNSDDRRLILRHDPGSDDWEEIEELGRLRPDEAFVVLRLYGGYSPEEVPILTSPQLTEDDHIQGLFDLRYIIPSEWENGIMGWLRTHPVMCLGVSALDWRHRMLLRWLYDQRPPPNGSLTLLGAEQEEREIWEKRGGGLPGKGHFAVVHEPFEHLVELLRGAIP